MLRSLLVGAVMTTVFVWSTPAAGACSCAPATDQEHFERADVVFEGKLVSRQAETEPGGDGVVSSTDPAVWTFAVTGVYKGTVRQTTAVYSPDDGASCGLEIPTTGEFYVFADWITADTAGPGYPIGELTSGLCSGTRTVDDGPLDLDPAVEPVAPMADASTTTAARVAPGSGVADIAEPATSGGVLVVGFLVVGVIAVVVAAQVARRSRA